MTHEPEEQPQPRQPEADHRPAREAAAGASADISRDHAAEEVPDAPVDWAEPATWPREVGGSRGPEPTRYGDWENNGRCTDF